MEKYNAAMFGRDFNPRAPRGARHAIIAAKLALAPISIHVPREGHDSNNCPLLLIHLQFQSTCPARGTTKRVYYYIWSISYFNPRAPRGARPFDIETTNIPEIISIHVPREGHDFIIHHLNTPICNFNPRAPRGARLCNTFYTIRTQYISIHVPREGHD